MHTRSKMFNCTKGIDVIATSDCEIVGTDIVPCNHQEPDTRIILHALHYSNDGHRRILLRSVDTDVVARSIATFRALSINE